MGNLSPVREEYPEGPFLMWKMRFPQLSEAEEGEADMETETITVYQGTGMEPVYLGILVVSSLILLLAVLLWVLLPPGGCGLLPHTLGEEVTVHGPPVLYTIRII